MILVLTVVVAFFGYVCVHFAHDTYPFAIPFVATAVLCSLAGVFAVVKNTRRAASVPQNGLVVITVVLYVLAVANWSGGDEVPGMILVGMVGPTLLLSAVLAIVSTIQNVRTTMKERRRH